MFGNIDYETNHLSQDGIYNWEHELIPVSFFYTLLFIRFIGIHTYIIIL